MDEENSAISYSSWQQQGCPGGASLLLGRHDTTSSTPLHIVLFSHRDGVSLPKVFTKTFAQHLCSQNLFMKSLLIRNEVQSSDGH